MKSDREMLAQALEALNLFNYRGDNDAELFQVGQIITLIKARLAEDDDVPVGYISSIGDFRLGEITGYTPLYRRPQPKARLSGEEILEVAAEAPPVYPWMIQGDVTLGDLRKMTTDFARAIEQKIWERAG